MKKIIKIFKVKKYHNREVEANFKQKEKEVIPLSQRLGKTFGERDQPEPIGDNLVPYIGEVKTICEGMIAYLDEQVQSHSLIPEYNTDKKKLQEEEVRVKEENTTFSNSLKNIKSEMENIDLEDVDAKVKIVLIVSTLLFISESVFNTIAFEAYGDNLLFSMALALPITLLILIMSHVFGTQIRKITNPTTKKIVIVGVLLAMIPLFYVLGSMRTMVLEKEGTTGISIFMFIIINYFFFIATAIVSYKYWPTKEERQKQAELKRLRKEYRKIENKLEANNTHITKLNADLNEKAIHINLIAYYREYSVDRIVKLYHKAVSVFIKNNIMHRNDRKTPDCCIEPYPELNIKDNFNYHLTTNKN